MTLSSSSNFIMKYSSRLTGAFSLGRYTVYPYVLWDAYILSQIASAVRYIFHFTAVDDNCQSNFVGMTDRADMHTCKRTRNTLRK